MFEYKGSLLDSISIAEEVAGSHQLNLSDNVGLADSLVMIPTPIFNTKDLGDTQSLAEAIDKFATVVGNSDTIAITEAKKLETHKALVSSILLADSSNKYQYAFPSIKWMAACHGGI
jgi:hypothetical protein